MAESLADKSRSVLADLEARLAAHHPAVRQRGSGPRYLRVEVPQPSASNRRMAAGALLPRRASLPTAALNLSISARNGATVVPMNRWVTVLLAALAMISAPPRVIAQTRGSAGSHPQGPTAGRPPHPGPSQPPPPSTVTAPPFRSPIIVSPTPVPAHRAFPVRSSWFGLVLFDPYWWAPSSVDQAFIAPPALTASDSGSTGGLQLDVEPRRALVYVDGWFVGVVDEFSGYYHHLDLGAGPHRIDLVASDYDPLFVAVVVSPGRTTTYRGWLNRR